MSENWRDAALPAADRVASLLAAMTVEQRIALALSDFAALYVSPGGSAPRALAGFARVRLAPGQTAPVRVELPADDLPTGEVGFLVGSSSRDIRRTVTVTLEASEAHAVHP